LNSSLESLIRMAINKCECYVEYTASANLSYECHSEYNASQTVYRQSDYNLARTVPLVLYKSHVVIKSIKSPIQRI